MSNPYDPQNPYNPQNPYQNHPQGFQQNPHQQPSNNGLSIASMVVSLVGLVCSLGIVLGPLGVILGHVALGQHKRNPMLRGRGMALAGVIIGWVVIVLWVLLALGLYGASAGYFGPEVQREFWS
ncbi:DUF4190 domain-containing protein [Saccharopolyspora sp. HNM0986]|uniref:DUF4190 domain-containing protein n=1 Tax=Saccharopolyspora galaxeae TaxID=2781241 RepID=UPI00190ACE2F|nr:DUF4190 domain-containing protein [Saccharopolyspora sp. HNM0986]MBK0868277.1 DUF4190 domain-containing protein [Saccharopolyspora sp. HNM0986]